MRGTIRRMSKLVRAVGLLGLTAMAVNGMIGAGIFAMPATVAGLLGPASPVAYWVAGTAVVLIALSFAEAGGMFDKAGGPYLYAHEAFGPFVGFEVGWMFLLGRVAGSGAITNAFVGYLGWFWPAAAHGWGRAAALTCMFAVMGGINYVGVRYGAWMVNVFTIGKLVPLLVFVGVGLFAMDSRGFVLAAPVEFGPLREAALALLFALGGFEFASIPSEEVVDSKRNLPIALVAAVSLGVVVYVLVQIVCLGTLPGLASSPAPLASAAGRFLGAPGAILLTLGAILSTTGTNSTILLIGPRLLYALAERGQIPAVFARVHPVYRTPHVAVVVFAIAAWAVSVAGTFAQLAILNSLARLLYSIGTCASVPVLRHRLPGSERRFQLPGGWLIPGLGIAASLFLLTGMNWQQATGGAAALVVGALIYRLAGRR